MSGTIPDEIHCRHCGNLLNSDTPVCPHCGVRNQYAQAPTGGGDVSIYPEHELASKTQVWKGVKGGLYASFAGLVLTSILFLFSVMSILKNLPEVIKSIPAVAAATAGGAALQSPGAAAAKFFGWVFFSSNFVGVTGSASAGQTSRSVTSNIVTELGQVTSLKPVLFHAIPIILLVLFGYSVSRSIGYSEIYENAAAGASVAIGYVLFALVGAMFGGIGFGASFGPSASVGPPLGQSVLFFGGLGVVCGGLGGLARHFTQQG